MELHLQEHDLSEGNLHTAALLRALASVLDPKPISEPVKLEWHPSERIEAAPARTPIPGSGYVGGATAQTANSAPSAEPEFGLDSAGMPWDERIHASSRATVADGTWKLKRGVDPELVAQVRGENHPAAPTEAERLQTEQERDVPDAAKVGFGAGVAVPPPPTAPAMDWPSDILGAIPEGKTPFQVFMTWAMTKISDKTLTQPRLLEVINSHGIAQLPVLNQQPEKIPAIVRDLAGA